MQIQEAIAASEYTSAAAYAGDGVDIIVGADGHDGRYGYALYTSMGQQGEDVHSMMLADIEREYPNLNWWPIRENGEWGEDAEKRADDTPAAREQEDALIISLCREAGDEGADAELIVGFRGNYPAETISAAAEGDVAALVELRQGCGLPVFR